MSQETKASNLSTEPPRGATSASEAAWRDGEGEKDLTDALHLSESTSQGTPPRIWLKITSRNQIVCGTAR
jgi:hypothetical protein